MESDILMGRDVIDAKNLIKTSKNTSMWNSVYSQIKSESDISLSAGNTGVLLVISRMILKTIN